MFFLASSSGSMLDSRKFNEKGVASCVLNVFLCEKILSVNHLFRKEVTEQIWELILKMNGIEWAMPKNT